MTLDLLREMVRGSRYFLIALVVLAVVDVSLYGYRTASQEPELERMQTAYFRSRGTGGDGATQRTVRYQNAARDLAQFQGRLIPKKEFARYLDDLFTMAQNHSLTLNAIGYKPAIGKGPIVGYGMTLDLSGKYGNLKGFLAELSRYPQMVAIDALTMGNTKATEESVDLHLQMTAFLKTEGA